MNLQGSRDKIDTFPIRSYCVLRKRGQSALNIDVQKKGREKFLQSKAIKGIMLEKAQRQ
jgi:hypothetical protein